MAAGDPSGPVAGLSCCGVTAAPGGAAVLRALDLGVEAGSRTVLVGPSGAGKTTLLRVVAGLERPVAGEIWAAGRRLDGLPAHRRRLAVVFQEPRLLPHLDVVDNVAFPLRAAGAGRTERRERARALLDEVGLGGVARRSIHGLSGGEQQRVALARALCSDPDLLMLDEPVAAVDPNRRQALRRLIVDLQRARGITTLFVTHDQGEAAELGERIALMIEGRIVQHGPPAALFERPASATVARFFGNRNLLRGIVRGGRLALAHGAELAAPGEDGPATLTIRPERIQLDGASPLRMRVVEAVYAGSHVRVRLRREECALEAWVEPDVVPPVGDEVGVELPARYLWRMPDEAYEAKLEPVG